MPAVALSQVAVHLRPEDNIAVAARHLAPGLRGEDIPDLERPSSLCERTHRHERSTKDRPVPDGGGSRRLGHELGSQRHRSHRACLQKFSPIHAVILSETGIGTGSLPLPEGYRKEGNCAQP